MEQMIKEGIEKLRRQIEECKDSSDYYSGLYQENNLKLAKAYRDNETIKHNLGRYMKDREILMEGVKDLIEWAEHRKDRDKLHDNYDVTHILTFVGHELTDILQEVRGKDED